MTQEYYHRRYTRRQPKPLAYLVVGFVIGAAVVNLVILLIGAPPCAPSPMACVAYERDVLPEFKRDPLVKVAHDATRRPFLVCQTGGAK